MKIGVISDTHIPKNARELPKEIFEHFKGVDMILHAGDIINLKVLDDLKEITPNIEAVIGNMDPSQNQSVLPTKKIIKVNGAKIGLTHGSGSPIGIKDRIWNEFKDEKPNIIVFGHTHRPEKTMLNNVLFLNPGSPTDKVFTSVNSIAILTIDNSDINIEIIKL